MSRFIVTCLIAACVITAGCGDGTGSRQPDPRAAGKPIVVASIPPLANVASRLLGDDVWVYTLLPGGGNPHAYEMAARDRALLVDAKAVIVVGLGFDAWAMPAADDDAKQSPAVLTMAQMLGMRGALNERRGGHDHDHHGHDHGSHDSSDRNPHLWLDPVRMQRFSARLADALSEQFPNMAASIRANAEALDGEFDALHGAYKQRLSALTNRKLITYHNAFDLLAKRYDLEVVMHLSPIALSPGGEVPPKRISEAIEAVKAHDLRALYAEPQLSAKAAGAVATQAEIRIMTLDPLGGREAEGYRDYFEMMQSNLQTLVDGQSQ